MNCPSEKSDTFIGDRVHTSVYHHFEERKFPPIIKPDKAYKK